MDKAKDKDYTMWCWSCGKRTMQPKDNYSECTNCGATYNDISAPGSPGKGTAIYETKPGWYY